MKSTYWSSMTTGLALMLVAPQAHAWFKFCNHGGVPIYMSIAYKDGGTFKSKGWWEVPANGGCVTAIGGDLANRYYYVHGQDTEGMFVSGDYKFCVINNRAVEIGDAETCSGANREMRGFVEVDTGDYKNYTYNVYDR